MPKKLRTIAVDSVVMLLSIGFFMLFLASSEPRYSGTEYSFDGGERQQSVCPFSVQTTGEKVTVYTIMFLPRFGPGFFWIKPDDCMESLTINGQPVTSGALQICHPLEQLLDLRPYLHPGMNNIEAVIADQGGDAKFSMRKEVRRDPIYLIPKLLVLASAGWFIFRRFAPNKKK